MLVVAVRLRVCALTRLRSNCSHHICAICAPPKLQCLQVRLIRRGLSTFCLTCHTQVWHQDLDLVNMQVRHDGALGRLRAARAPLLSLSNPLSLCFAVSPFDTLVAAIDDSRVKGTDNALAPLSQHALDAMRDNFAFMKQCVQHMFKFLDGTPLSEDDADGFAFEAMVRLRGTLLLQPYMLGRACTIMSVSPPHRRMVCVLTHICISPIADIHAARRCLRDLAGTRCPRDCCTWVVAHPAVGVVLLCIPRGACTNVL